MICHVNIAYYDEMYRYIALYIVLKSCKLNNNIFNAIWDQEVIFSGLTEGLDIVPKLGVDHLIISNWN